MLSNVNCAARRQHVLFIFLLSVSVNDIGNYVRGSFSMTRVVDALNSWKGDQFKAILRIIMNT